jgi:hypothetical protein
MASLSCTLVEWDFSAEIKGDFYCDGSCVCKGSLDWKT